MIKIKVRSKIYGVNKKVFQNRKEKKKSLR